MKQQADLSSKKYRAANCFSSQLNDKPSKQRIRKLGASSGY
jgi:hypothetical protein